MPSFYSGTSVRPIPTTSPHHYGFPSSLARDIRQLPALHLSGHISQSVSHELVGSEVQEVRQKYSRYNHTSALHPSFPQENPGHGHSTYTGSTKGPLISYNVATVPLLPPIRLPENRMDDHQHVRSKHAPTMTPPKEEKVVGGVAAHLDYEMEDMVDFVSETAQGMYGIYGSKICLADIDISRSVVDSKTLVHPDFRKFVSQVLSSTRLPSSTILLGLQYLASRMTLLSIQGNFKYGNGSVRRMLTTALLLGSKFLDDNTFQNRSWSEVSNIPVNELNSLEVEWLTAIDWEMHVNPSDPVGYVLWHQQWQRYQVNKVNRMEPLLRSLKQTHLNDNTVQRQHPFHHPHSNHDALPYSERLEGNCPMENSSWAGPFHESWPPLQSQMDYSPPSAPETGPTTPEWYNSQSGFVFGPAQSQPYPFPKLAGPLQITGVHAPPADYQAFHAQQYNSYNHSSTCPCGHCLSRPERLFMAPDYGLQPVVG